MIESYEKRFLTYLLLLSALVLGWLFYPFFPSLFFALILASSTSFGYNKFIKMGKTPNVSAGIMVLLLAVTIVLPFTYLMIEGIIQITNLYNYLNSSNLFKLNNQGISEWLLESGVTEEYIAYIKKIIDSNVENIIGGVKNVTLVLSKNVFNNTLGFLSFIVVTLFVLFFFYVDGKKVVDNLKIISPLNDSLDEKIFSKFAYMSSILTITVFTIALLQGLSFGLIMGILGLPIMFTAALIAVTSFIPVIGSFLIWFPISMYFAAESMWISMVVTIVWGAGVNGVLIDNILRPIIVKKVSSLLVKGKKIKVDDFNPLDHTMILVLSTFAGLLNFGVLGLFTGPIIASLAITIFEMYRDYVSPVIKSVEPLTDVDKVSSGNNKKEI